MASHSVHLSGVSKTVVKRVQSDIVFCQRICYFSTRFRSAARYGYESYAYAATSPMGSGDPYQGGFRRAQAQSHGRPLAGLVSSTLGLDGVSLLLRQRKGKAGGHGVRITATRHQVALGITCI